MVAISLAFWSLNVSLFMHYLFCGQGTASNCSPRSIILPRSRAASLPQRVNRQTSALVRKLMRDDLLAGIADMVVTPIFGSLALCVKFAHMAYSVTAKWIRYMTSGLAPL